MKIQNQNILIVDDRPENILVLESILEESGRTFVKANSGEEALKILLKQDISLILLDVQMPGIDGFETAQLIRQSQRTKNIPIIFVTAISKEQKHVFKGYEAGAVDYLFKPVEPEIVKSKVKIFLELDKQRRMLEYQNDALTAAKKNTDNILHNVEEGLFLLDNQYRIKPNYASILEHMFEIDNLSGKNILEIFKDRLQKKDYQSAEDYLELMFRNDLSEDDFSDLNPLSGVPFKVKNGSKYLSFRLKRIYTEKKIEELIITVRDITSKITLQYQLEKSEATSKRQIDLLHILNTEPLLLKNFLDQTSQDLIVLKSRIKSQLDRKETECVYRIAHSIKGNASLMNFQYLAEKAHEFEEILKTLRYYKNEREERLDQLREIVSEMVETVKDINKLIEDISHFYQQFNAKETGAGKLIIKAVTDMIDRLNKELNLNVVLRYQDFDQESVQPEDFLFLKDILIQLTRNAMHHGVEPLAERKKKNKSDTPAITLSSEIKNGKFVVSFKDNGRGLQLDKIKSIALDRKLFDEEKIRKMTKEKIAELIYSPGLSTADQTTMNAGRGFGMNLVRQKILEKSGEIQVKYEEGKYCQFNISTPLTDTVN